MTDTEDEAADPWDHRHGPLVDPATVPDWLAPLVIGTSRIDPAAFRLRVPPNSRPRAAAVLALFGVESPDAGPDVLLLRRADTLGSHAGQVAFPGGGADPDDDGPVGTALREAVEEVGVDPAGVRPVALLPKIFVPVSGFQVTPVLAHWTTPSTVHAVDPAETAAVARIPIAHLVDPANRLMVRHSSGFVSPGYLAPGMLIWGFTAGVLTALLGAGGWDRPWDDSVVYDVDAAWHVAMDRQRPAPGTLPPADAEVRR
jgi:8-oxo-dGTP pyrophosphatase MutT (NUDIX family)